jgi:hypothetical protein
MLRAKRRGITDVRVVPRVDHEKGVHEALSNAPRPRRRRESSPNHAVPDPVPMSADIIIAQVDFSVHIDLADAMRPSEQRLLKQQHAAHQ